MKHWIKNTALALAMLMSITVSAAHTAGAKSSHWYCANVDDHQRPTADASFSYIGQYDGYYISPDETDRVIYLTFDAGYENGNVTKILDVLKQKQVPAAFFVLSHLIEAEPALVSRMFDEGHLVCNHTAHHKDMAKVTDPSAFEAELRALEQVCLERTGREIAHYYRPPEGSFNEQNLKQAQAMGYKTVFWSFAYADWDNGKQMSADSALEKILSNIHAGEVMLLHPTSSTNAAVLGEVIDECRAMGYRFGTLDELTADR